MKIFLKKIISKSKFLSIIYNFKIINSYLRSYKIIFIAENKSWSILDDGLSLARRLNKNYKKFMIILPKPGSFNNKTLHFGSQFVWTSWCDQIPSDNKIIVSYFHGKPTDDDFMKWHIKKFLSSLNKIDLIITSTEKNKKRLIKWGVKDKQISIVPIGVDSNIFIKMKNEIKNKLFIKYKIPKDKIIIGSFQKDGVGWEEGNEPKLIKGPDIFIKSVEKIKRYYDPFIILTGPSRGFVKKGLKKLKIKYLHLNVSNKQDLAELYNLLDFYFICSREEGGPKGLIEAMSCGVTVIANNVGMVDTLINNKKNGYIVDFKPESFCKYFLLHTKLTKKQRALLSLNAQKAAKNFDWNLISRKYYNEVTRFIG